MKEVINKAIEGGWKPFKSFDLLPTDKLEQIDFETMICWRDGKGHGSIHFNRVLLDPLFWQSLGKALGWQDEPYEYTNEHNIPAWHAKWLMFIDHLAEGKDAESYFNELLK